MQAVQAGGQGRSIGRTIIIPLHKCDVRERGGWGVSKCLGGRQWSRRREKDTGRMNLNSGSRAVVGRWGSVSLQQMDYCVASRGEWVLRVFLVPAVACSLSHTSPLCLRSAFSLLRPSLTLLCSLLFCLLVHVAPLLTFCFHTKRIRCRFHSETSRRSTFFFLLPLVLRFTFILKERNKLESC